MVEFRDSLSAFLAEPRIGILATLHVDGTPRLTGVWYVYEDDVVKVCVVEGCL